MHHLVQRMAPPTFTAIYKTIGDCEISTDVYLPPAPRQPKSPVLINLHGGAFMLGASSMVNKDQIQDCLDRGWIVVIPNHRLCPQVDILQGPVQDIRDLLAWIDVGHLDSAIEKQGKGDVKCDLTKIFAFGTSAGGHIALCLGFNTPNPPAAILDFYGPCNFVDPFWKSKLPMAAKLPKFPEEFTNQVYDESPIPTEGGTSLEGQSQGGPNFEDPRVAFAMTHIANGTLLDACFPSGEFEKIDPLLNISSSFPPTCIVHGQADTMVPMYLSTTLFEKLKSEGVESEMIEVPGEEHTFAGKMMKGSVTWNIQRKGFDWLEKFT